jgi:CRP-like cAMP-binding protein
MAGTAPTKASRNARAIQALAQGDTQAALTLGFALEDEALQTFVTLCAVQDEALRDRLAERLARIALATGDFEPAALALSSLSAEQTTLRDELARTFAKGSTRLSAKADHAPPPLAKPSLMGVPAVTLSDLEKRAATLAGAKPPAASTRPIVPVPVFSELEADALVRLMSAFEVRIVDAGTRLCSEGEEGIDAYFIAYGNCVVETERHGKVGELGPGQIFGEIALLARSPRVASVRASTPLVVLVASRASLEAAAADAPEIATVLAQTTRRRVIESVSRSSPLLRNMVPAERTRLLALFEFRSYEQGEYLVRFQDPPKGLFLLASGFVSVTRKEGADTLLLKRLAPGEVLGEVALVLRRHANADVTADSPTLCLFLAEARFLELCEAHPLVLRHLYLTAISRDAETERARAEEAAAAEPYVLV